jgi:hypothetical protein
VAAGTSSHELRLLKPSTHENGCHVSCRVKESWREVDSRYSVSNRLKHSRDDVQRMLPHWRRRFRQFSRTRAGRISLWAVFIYSITSGLLFRVSSGLLTCTGIALLHHVQSIGVKTHTLELSATRHQLYSIWKGLNGGEEFWFSCLLEIFLNVDHRVWTP